MIRRSLFLSLVLTTLVALGGSALAQSADWRTLPLTDARTGDTFTLAGQTVYVEPMATWCVNCRQQLGRVGEAKAQLDAQAEGEVTGQGHLHRAQRRDHPQ